MGRLAQFIAAAALAAALYLQFGASSGESEPVKEAAAACDSDDICLVSIF